MKRFSMICVASCLLAGAAAVQASEVQLNCGGIGKEESDAMLAQQSQHALTVLFSTPGGSYVSGVDTKVGNPLDDVVASNSSCGPVAHVDVEQEGRYRVVGTLNGETVEQWVNLKPQGGERVVMHFAD